jgi:signal transduction histidine kinase
MLSPKVGYRVMSESFAYGGKVVGAYAMRYRTQVTSLSSDPAAPFMFIFFLLGLAALIALLTGIVSTGIARSFGKLEKAAERIASGDIESAIPQGRRGLREMSALAAAMERMRGALQDERSRRARFLASVSHDLRTPLTSIKGYIEAVEDGMAADGETLERYTRIMNEKASMLEDRVNELLDFARMGTGEWRLRRVELPLRRYLQGLCAAYREDAAAAGRSFDFALDDLGERAVLADPKMFSRALENVFNNALRYSPSGGMVGLKASVSGERIELVFSDSGPGIPKDELERIFEPYFRGKSAAAEGEGLGLAISRSILHDHGWLIRASSPPEGGARFTVTIVPADPR